MWSQGKSDLSILRFLTDVIKQLDFGLFTDFVEEETNWWQLEWWLYQVDLLGAKLRID